MEPFEIIWHRAGNSAAGLAWVERQLDHGPRAFGDRPIRHSVELDLKWATGGGRPTLYGWHGLTGTGLLSPEALGNSGDAVTLVEQMLASPLSARVGFLFEIKGGVGPGEAALEELERQLESSGAVTRARLSASSLPLLDVARRAAPRMRQVLFVAHLSRSGVALHLPMADVCRGLRRGVLLPARAIPVETICPVFLRPRSVAGHVELAASLERSGQTYLPGRVYGWRALEALSRAGLPGAFVYGERY